MKIDDLKLNEANPQKYHDLEVLKKSLTRFPSMMKLRPIVYEKDTMKILGGNKRWLSLKELGYKEIPDEWTVCADDLTDEQKKEFIIKDNVLIGEWDFDILNNGEWDTEELEEWGVDMFEIVNDENMLSRSSPRGGMSTGGIKFVIGNFTKYIAPDNELIELACQTQDRLIEMSEEERDDAIEEILKLFSTG